MNFNCYCPGGYLRNGQVPPQNNIYSLPFELLAKIIRNAAGTNNIPKALVTLDLVSKEWKRAVDYIWQVNGEEILSEQFPAEKIEEVTEIITKFRREATAKNIYRLLTARMLPLLYILEFALLFLST